MTIKHHRTTEKDYKAYRRKGQIAVNFLYRKKQGQIKDALFHKKIGWIDIVWGYAGTGNKDGWGLAKIAKFHPEALRKLALIVKFLPIKTESNNRYILEDKKYRAIVSRDMNGKEKLWLLTAFEKKEA